MKTLSVTDTTDYLIKRWQKDIEEMTGLTKEQLEEHFELSDLQLDSIVCENGHTSVRGTFQLLPKGGVEIW